MQGSSFKYKYHIDQIDGEYSYLIGLAIAKGHCLAAIIRAKNITEKILEGKRTLAKERKRVFFKILMKLAFSKKFWEEEREARKKIMLNSVEKQYKKAGFSEKEIRQRLV